VSRRDPVLINIPVLTEPSMGKARQLSEKGGNSIQRANLITSQSPPSKCHHIGDKLFNTGILEGRENLAMVFDRIFCVVRLHCAIWCPQAHVATEYLVSQCSTT
jgi:hypothetical protein